MIYIQAYKKNKYDKLEHAYAKNAEFVGIEEDYKGYAGGDCYGGDAKYYINELSISALELLKILIKMDIADQNNILEIIDNIKEGSYTDEGYYGNYSVTKVYYIDVKFLKNLENLENE